MLHIRRFRFRVISYLESYTMFVASTINILDLKDGYDPEAAGAGVALSLDIFRNATSTPSNARCVEIIEQLMRTDDVSPDGQARQLQAQPNWPQPAPVPAVSESVSRRQSMHSNRPAQPIPPQSLYASTTDFAQAQQHLNLNLAKASPNQGYPSFIDGPNLLSPTSLQMDTDYQVDTPMRWMADNVGTNTRPESWMMMDMDFNNTFNNDPFPSG